MSPEISQESAQELLMSCKELREACAAAMRVLEHMKDGADFFMFELQLAKVENGFGVRAQEAIAKAERTADA